MKFHYTGPVEIAHLNTRKEGPDEAKELAVDLKCEAVADSGMCDFFDDNLSMFLFIPGGAVRNKMLEPIAFAHELENYRVEIAGSRHYGCRVKKFKISPLDTYKVRIGFQVSFKPSGDEVARIAEYLQDEIQISVEPETSELDFDGTLEGARKNLEAIAARDGTTMEIADAQGSVLASFGASDDELYETAKEVVTASGKASISLVQRHLRIGYNRAARLIDSMEANGVVSKVGSDGARTVIPQ